MLILSASSLNTYENCPKWWEYEYVHRRQRIPSFKMALGSAAHVAVEMAMRERIETGSYPEKEAWEEAFIEAWKWESSDSFPRNDSWEESREAYEESGLLAVNAYRTKVAPGIVPVLVEHPIRYTIFGYVWTGQIDLVAEYRGGCAIRDHKFVGRRPDPADQRYRVNMIGYAIGYRHELEDTETDVILDHIIRTKKPYPLPIANGGPVSKEDIEWFADKVEVAGREIELGNFPALGPDTGACNWCPFWEICPSYRGRRAKGDN